jgi:hypothetical protein
MTVDDDDTRPVERKEDAVVWFRGESEMLANGAKVDGSAAVVVIGNVAVS